MVRFIPNMLHPVVLKIPGQTTYTGTVVKGGKRQLRRWYVYCQVGDKRCKRSQLEMLEDFFVCGFLRLCA